MPQDTNSGREGDLRVLREAPCVMMLRMMTTGWSDGRKINLITRVTHQETASRKRKEKKTLQKVSIQKSSGKSLEAVG